MGYQSIISHHNSGQNLTMVPPLANQDTHWDLLLALKADRDNATQAHDNAVLAQVKLRH
jgi:hypothetical protein